MPLDEFNYRERPPFAYARLDSENVNGRKLIKINFFFGETRTVRRIKCPHVRGISTGRIGDVCEMRSITARLLLWAKRVVLIEIVKKAI